MLGKRLPGGLPRCQAALTAMASDKTRPVTGEALIRRDRHWHLSAGRWRRRCHLHELHRSVRSARADPANEGCTG